MEIPARDLKDFVTTGLVTFLLCLWMYWMWSRRHLYLFALKVPGHFGLPVIGSFFFIKDFRNILQVMGSLFLRCKSYTSCLWFGFYPAMILADPELIEKVLTSPELLNKSNVIYPAVYEALQGGLIGSPASIWKSHRKTINPSFQHKALISFLPVFQRAKNDLISMFDKLANNGEHKLNEMLQSFTVRISFETTLGRKDESVNEAGHVVTSLVRFLMDKIMFHGTLMCLNIGSLIVFYPKYQNAKKQCYEIVRNLLEKKFKEVNEAEKMQIKGSGGTSKTSMNKPIIFIDHLIENYKKQIFSFNDLIAESNNIFAASFETTANGIHSALVMLAMHPDVQERLFEEIVNIFPEKNFEMGYENFDQLPYLDMVVNETLRLAPSIPIFGRQVIKNTKLSEELTLPKGLGIIISAYHTHRRKDIWGPNANSFNPDNFLPANMAGRHPYAYIPFSKGVRNCIGWRYALFVMKVVLAGVVRNYRFSTSTKYEDVDYIVHVALKHRNEPLLRIHRRE